MNPKVDLYFDKLEKWKPELEKLRSIILDCQLDEELKWNSPCYNYKGTNIIIIGGLKDACILSFFKGVLLGDSDKILHSPGDNSQSARIFRFKSLKEIEDLEAIIKAYIYEAIEVEKAGLTVDLKASENLEYPPELEEKFNGNEAFKTAFESLTTGRQRAYLIFFTGAKQSKTITSRIENYTQRILDGFGFNDCTCGLSRKKPNCDGSHKFIPKKT